MAREAAPSRDASTSVVLRQRLAAVQKELAASRAQSSDSQIVRARCTELEAELMELKTKLDKFRKAAMHWKAKFIEVGQSSTASAPADPA